MEDKVKVWLARDKDGKLYAHSKRPNKMKTYWENEVYAEIFRLNSSLFPSVKWEDDEPTEAYITLAEPQEQPKQEQPTPKQEIDWEQRRYEMAKEMMVEIYRHKIAVSEPGQAIAIKDIVDVALLFCRYVDSKAKREKRMSYDINNLINKIRNRI